MALAPFLPAGGAGAAGAQADVNARELRGIMSTPRGMRYCIYDPARRESSWVAVSEPGTGFTVQSADPEHERVTVLQNGRRLTISLREGRVAPGGIPTYPGMVSRQDGSLPAVLRPTPEDEQRRLQAIAIEVRQRRLLREQQSQHSQEAAPSLRPQ